MQNQELNIAELNQFYQFDFALNEFVVTDEKSIVREDSLPFRINGYTLVICVKGKFVIEIDTHLHTIKKNFILIAKPLQLFRFIEQSNDCRVRVIIFSERFIVANNIHHHVIDSFHFTHPNAVPLVTVTERDAQQMVQQFKSIWERFNETKHPFRKEVVANLLLVLLHDFETIYRHNFCPLHNKNTRAENLTKNFTKLVRKHFRKEHGVDFYARKLNITPKYLTTVVKETTGRNASAFITEILMIEAQTLLLKPEVSIKEVTHLLHFPDQSTFGKFFKRTTGTSPLAYKKGAIKI